jgi:DNA modification methylase
MTLLLPALTGLSARAAGTVLVGDGVITLPSISGAIPGIDVNWIWWSDVMDFLCQLPDSYVDLVVTSPPYFHARSYDVDGQLGLEPTIEQFVATLVAVFSEVRRILKKSGNLFINLGDGYSRDGIAAVNPVGKTGQMKGRKLDGRQHQRGRIEGLEPKNLMGIPWRVALALQQNGWILRGDAPWLKKSTLPESVRDRFVKSHEYVFHFAKSQDYFFDLDAIRKPASDVSLARISQPNFANQKGGKKDYGKTGVNRNRSARKALEGFAENPGRNYRSTDMWFTSLDEQISRLQDELTHLVNLRDNGGILAGDRTIDAFVVNPEPSAFQHYAAYPTKLVEPCILAGCPEEVCGKCGKPYEAVIEREFVPQQDVSAERVAYRGKMHDKNQWDGFPRGHTVTKRGPNQPICKCGAGSKPGLVLDPFAGTNTTGLVAERHGRNWIGCELNPDYIKIAKEKLRKPFEQHHIQKETDLQGLPLFAFEP